MTGRNGYAVYFFPQALEALGPAIQPYLQDGPNGPCVQCHEVDTGGAFIELTQNGRDAAGQDVALELMVPSAMVRMIVSMQSDPAFGFGPRGERAVAQMPVLGPTAAPVGDPSQALPAGGEATSGSDAPSGSPQGPVDTSGSVDAAGVAPGKATA